MVASTLGGFYMENIGYYFGIVLGVAFVALPIVLLGILIYNLVKLRKEVLERRRRDSQAGDDDNADDSQEKQTKSSDDLPLDSEDETSACTSSVFDETSKPSEDSNE